MKAFTSGREFKRHPPHVSKRALTIDPLLASCLSLQITGPEKRETRSKTDTRSRLHILQSVGRGTTCRNVIGSFRTYPTHAKVHEGYWVMDRMVIEMSN